MQKNNRCIIVGGGSSVRENNWNIPVQNIPIWSILNNEASFSLNWSYMFYNPTIAIGADYQFIITEKEKMNKLPMIVAINDSYYQRKGSIRPGENTFLINASNAYHSEDSWKKGFYSKELCGIFAINFALRCGFDKIFCLGMDACEINGHTHFYDDNPEIGKHAWNGSERYGVGRDERGYYRSGVYNKPKELNDTWYKPLEVEKDKVINVSLKSAINTFPKWSYEQFYQYLKDNPVQINQDETRESIKQLIRKNL